MMVIHFPVRLAEHKPFLVPVLFPQFMELHIIFQRHLDVHIVIPGNEPMLSDRTDCTAADQPESQAVFPAKILEVQKHIKHFCLHFFQGCLIDLVRFKILPVCHNLSSHPDNPDLIIFHHADPVLI